MQRELFNNIFKEFIKCFRPFKRAAMMLILAHGEREFDAPALRYGPQSPQNQVPWKLLLLV